MVRQTGGGELGVAGAEFLEHLFTLSGDDGEIGMTRATGKPYRHVIEILEELTRPRA